MTVKLTATGPLPPAGTGATPGGDPRRWLACGVVAGPLYVTVTLVEALTRTGFDLRRHRFSWLTAGDLGWIHQASMLAAGALTVAMATGVARRLPAGRAARAAAALLALFGLAYVAGGLLTADPVAGFPPGTAAADVRTTLAGTLQDATRGASTLLLLATSAAVAWSFAGARQRRRAWLSGTGVPWCSQRSPAWAWPSAATRPHWPSSPRPGSG